MFFNLNFSFLDIFLFLKNFCSVKCTYCSGSVEHKDKEQENLFINKDKEQKNLFRNKCRSHRVKFNLVPQIASRKMF